MKIRMKMNYSIQAYNEKMQYVVVTVTENQIVEVQSVEKYDGKYTHMNTMNMYVITFHNGRKAWLTDSLFAIVEVDFL